MSREGPGEQYLDASVHQISARIHATEERARSDQDEISALKALRGAMLAARVHSVARLPPELRTAHRDAIRLAAGRSRGVEMW